MKRQHQDEQWTEKPPSLRRAPARSAEEEQERIHRQNVPVADVEVRQHRQREEDEREQHHHAEVRRPWDGSRREQHESESRDQPRRQRPFQRRDNREVAAPSARGLHVTEQKGPLPFDVVLRHAPKRSDIFGGRQRDRQVKRPIDRHHHGSAARVRSRQPSISERDRTDVKKIGSPDDNEPDCERRAGFRDAVKQPIAGQPMRDHHAERQCDHRRRRELRDQESPQHGAEPHRFSPGWMGPPPNQRHRRREQQQRGRAVDRGEREMRDERR